MSYKHNFRRGDIIEEKSTGTRGVILSVEPGLQRSRSSIKYELVRYYLFYVPENPRYNNTIVVDRPALINSHYRVITS